MAAAYLGIAGASPCIQVVTLENMAVKSSPIKTLQYISKVPRETLNAFLLSVISVSHHLSNSRSSSPRICAERAEMTLSKAKNLVGPL